MKRLTLSPHIGSPHPRRGVFLFVAMICLLLTSTLLGARLKMASASRKQAQFEGTTLQAEWLAESALDRAMAKLSSDANYQGETWDVAAEEIGGIQAGQVLIAVKKSEASPLRDVEAVAHFPWNDPRTVKRTKRIRVQVAAPVVEGDATTLSPAFAEKPGEMGR